MTSYYWIRALKQCRRVSIGPSGTKSCQIWSIRQISLFQNMMTSSNGNIFRVTGHLCGEFTGPRWIPRTKASDALMSSFICVWINDWVNNREAGDLRRYRAYYHVIVTKYIMSAKWQNVCRPIRWNHLLILACLQVDGILSHPSRSTIRSMIMVIVWCGLNRWMQKPCSQQLRGKHIYHIILFFKTPDTMQAAVIHNEWNQNIKCIVCANLRSEKLFQAMSQ